MDIAVIVTALAVVLMALQSLPLDQSIPGGTDTYSHLFRAWYATEYNLPQWNFFWWGGTTFLRYYSPLTYRISAVIGGLVGWLFAYKLLVDVFFVSLPVAFYFLSKDYLPDVKQRAVAVLVFSLSPIYLYAFFDGRYPTLMSLLFCMVYWIFLKKCLDEGSPHWLLLSSLALGLAIPLHLLISGYTVIVTVFWAFLHSARIKTVRTLALILLFALLFSAWFLIPVFIETGGFSDEGTSPSNLFEAKDVIGTGAFVLSMPFFWITQFSSFAFSPWIVFLGTMLLLAISFLTVMKPNRTVREFLLVLILMLAIAMVSWRRILLLAPIPLAVLSAYGMFLVKNPKFRAVLIVVVMLFVFGSFASLSRTHLEAAAPNLPYDGRVLFIPNEPHQSLFLSPMKGNENIEGWWTIGEVSAKRYAYFPLLFNFSSNGNEYYRILNAGWVNYVAVRDDRADELSYFKGSDRFRAINNSEGYAIFELSPKSTYLELDGNPVPCERITGRDSVSVDFNCSPGTLTIKESRHQFWNVSINGRVIAYRPSEYDFMEADIDESGDCRLEMSFSEPPYYAAFKALCIIPIVWFGFRRMRAKAGESERRLP